MKGREIKYFFITVLVISFCCSCHKYRDDELISFKTPFKRITTHNWHVNYFGINYQDSTTHLYPDKAFTNGISMNNREFIFGSFDVSQGGGQKIYNLYIDSFPSYTWTFNGPKEVNIMAGGLNDTPTQVLNNSNWTILKLTDKDFHISTMFNKKNYEIYFSK